MRERSACRSEPRIEYHRPTPAKFEHAVNAMAAANPDEGGL